MDRQHERARGRDLEARAHFDARGLELTDLLQQRARRQHDAVADVDADVRTQHARGNEAQHRLAPADDERVAGVVAAVIAHDARRALGEPVDDLALALVAPLRADDDNVLAHGYEASSTCHRPCDCTSQPARLHSSRRAARRPPRRPCARSLRDRFARVARRRRPVRRSRASTPRSAGARREAAQVHRESCGGARAPERAADAVVAAAATAIDDRAVLALREHRERRARVVVIAAQVGEVDVDRVDVSVTVAASVASASSALSTIRQRRAGCRAPPPAWRPRDRTAWRAREARRARAPARLAVISCTAGPSLSRSAAKSSLSLPSPVPSSPAARASARYRPTWPRSRCRPRMPAAAASAHDRSCTISRSAAMPPCP